MKEHIQMKDLMYASTVGKVSQLPRSAHEKSHKEVTSYICKFCEKEFKNISSQKNDMRKDTQKKKSHLIVNSAKNISLKLDI